MTSKTKSRIIGFLTGLIIISLFLTCLGLFTAKALADSGWTDLQQTAHDIAQMARDAGLPDDNPIIVECSRIWWAEENAKLTEPEPYPVAKQVWDYLHSLGLSDQVCAGILGNMMAECGGQTLDLQPYVWGGGGNYYGLCQWSSRYYPQVANQGVDGQLQTLMDTIESTMREAGGNYGYFLTITSAYDAAYYFEKYYERAGWSSIRGNNALVALDHFT